MAQVHRVSAQTIWLVIKLKDDKHKSTNGGIGMKGEALEPYLLDQIVQMKRVGLKD